MQIMAQNSSRETLPGRVISIKKSLATHWANWSVVIRCQLFLVNFDSIYGSA